MGDFSDYTTIYRQDYSGNSYMLSNDKSVYIDSECAFPPIIEPHLYTEDELQLIEINNKILEINNLINLLKLELNFTDYKVIKNLEYAEAGIDVEYEPTELNAERQTYRDAINAAETELTTLIGGVDDAS